MTNDQGPRDAGFFVCAATFPAGQEWGSPAKTKKPPLIALATAYFVKNRLKHFCEPETALQQKEPVMNTTQVAMTSR